MTNSLFEPPFGEVRGNVRTSSTAHWKAHIDFLFAKTEHISLALTLRRSHHKEILVEVGVFTAQSSMPARSWLS